MKKLIVLCFLLYTASVSSEECHKVTHASKYRFYHNGVVVGGSSEIKWHRKFRGDEKDRIYFYLRYLPDGERSGFDIPVFLDIDRFKYDN